MRHDFFRLVVITTLTTSVWYYIFSPRCNIVRYNRIKGGGYHVINTDEFGFPAH